MAVRLSTKLLVLGGLVAAMIACSSETVDGQAEGAEGSFCTALSDAYTKCANHGGGGGGTSTCSDTMRAECTKMVSILNPSVLKAATTCVESGSCDSDPLSCIGKSLAEVTPTDAQTKFAESYCGSCSSVGGAPCTSAFFGVGKTPGLGIALLPFGEKPLSAVEKSCTSNALGKTACQAAFSTCLTTTATKVLVETISADAVKCVLTGIKDGVTNAGSSSSGSSSSSSSSGGSSGTSGSSGIAGCTDCAGCCLDGKCQDGTDGAACGTGGAACETCSSGAACTKGVCVTACGPDNCTGCCDSNGQCQTGSASSTCGSGGEACATCTGSKTCSGGQCIDTSCQSSCTSGCCSATGCQTGNSVGACGSGGNACVACGGGRVCTTGGVCSLATTSTWDVVLVAAHLPKKNGGGGDWDAFAGLPDPMAQATSNTTTGVTTASKSDTLNATWNVNVLENVSATSLKSHLKIEVWDDDTVFNDHVGICMVTITDPSFDGTLKTASCPPVQSGDVTFTIDYRLKAH